MLGGNLTGKLLWQFYFTVNGEETNGDLFAHRRQQIFIDPYYPVTYSIN
jgi:hypothetical protein